MTRGRNSESRRVVLCASDLTARSDGAVRRAAALADQIDARAVFVHAVDASQPDEVIRMQVNRAHVQLRSDAERAMCSAAPGFETEVRLGKPLQAIAEAAREWQPQFIVIAAPRRRAFDALIGTAAERLIRSAHCPVLAVRGSLDGSYKRVVIATDLGASFESIARTAADICVLSSADTWIVHAFDHLYHGVTAANERERTAIVAYERRLRDGITVEIARELEEIGVSLARVRISVLPAQPIEAIESVTQYVKPDLVVIGANPSLMLRRLIAGSVAHEVFRRADCDILAVPPSAARKGWLRAA